MPGTKCPVYLLDLFISKLPPKAVQNDIFYARPLKSVPTDSSAPWYSATPVGKHTLNDNVKKMCMAAGIQGNKTNHSLRATGGTHMFSRKKYYPRKDGTPITGRIALL